MKSSKIKSPLEISKIVKGLRRKGKKIVTCNGTFDLFHVGHLFFLSQAKKQGDVLIVGLNSDRSVKLNKGPNRPLIDQGHRATMLSGLQCVDYVVIFNEREPHKFLSWIRPDVHCNGAEYGRNCVEAGTVRRYKGKLKLIKSYGDFRTTNLVKKIKNSFF